MLFANYTEPGYQPIPDASLSDAGYAIAIQSFVIVCTDVVLINREQKRIYLARRNKKPLQGYWWIGGRMRAGETKEESAIRVFKRETDFTLFADQLQLVALHDHRWKDRQQPPQNIGCHVHAWVFAVEPTEGELSFIASNLTETEYEGGLLVGFNRRQLLESNVAPPVVTLYDHIFPQSNV